MAQQAFLRSGRTLLTAVRPASQSLYTYHASISSRCLSSAALRIHPLRRPTIAMNVSSAVTVAGRMDVVKGVQEQVRGMKVRSSVKKLCEGCKVCLYSPIDLAPGEISRRTCNMEALLGVGAAKDLRTIECNLANETPIGSTKEGRQEG